MYSLILSSTWKKHLCLYSIVSLFFLDYISTHLHSTSDKMGEPKERWKTVLMKSYAWEHPVWFCLLWKRLWFFVQFCTWSQLLCYHVRLAISPVSRSHGPKTHKGSQTPWSQMSYSTFPKHNRKGGGVTSGWIFNLEIDENISPLSVMSNVVILLGEWQVPSSPFSSLFYIY